MALKLLSAVALLAVPAAAFTPSTLPSTITHSSPLSATPINNDVTSDNNKISRRSAMYSLAGLTVSPLFLPTLPASARLEGVNKPELLPSEPGLNVIQVEKFLTKGKKEC